MPPAALSSILGVLRRARSSAAELPPGGVSFGYSVLWVNYVHLLATGPDQTRYFLIPGIIDAQLSALIDPSAPMPSFKNLPAAKFKAVVEFLSELR